MIGGSFFFELINYYDIMNTYKILYLIRKDVALDDMATAILIYRIAREKGRVYKMLGILAYKTINKYNKIK